MVKKMKSDVDSLILVLIVKKCSSHILLELNFFIFFEPKVAYLHPFLSCLLLTKFWKQSLMYFGHKHVEIWNQSNLLISEVSHAFKLISLVWSCIELWSALFLKCFKGADRVYSI